MKLVMLLEELDIPHRVVIVNDPGKQDWYKRINPLGLVPSLADTVQLGDDKDTGSTVNVFESSSCMTFLVDKYDTEKRFCGKNLYERTIVGNWMTLHTASLGSVILVVRTNGWLLTVRCTSPTAKWWLWFKVKSPDTIGNTLDLYAPPSAILLDTVS